MQTETSSPDHCHCVICRVCIVLCSPGSSLLVEDRELAVKSLITARGDKFTVQ